MTFAGLPPSRVFILLLLPFILINLLSLRFVVGGTIYNRSGTEAGGDYTRITRE